MKGDVTLPCAVDSVAYWLETVGAGPTQRGSDVVNQMDFREYENGIADILGFLLGPTRVVSRNVSMPGHLSLTNRQIDITIEGPLLDRPDAVVVVDCKRWAANVDVADVGSFIDLVRDVGADGGLLIASSGASRAAVHRADAEQSHHVEVVGLDELNSWIPPGTVTMSVRIPATGLQTAESALRRIGHRVRVAQGWPEEEGTVVVESYRHYGTAHPSGEMQTGHHDSGRVALATAGVEAIQIASGITIGGGTPASRWIPVLHRGTAVGLKILAATEAEADDELDRLAAPLNLDRAELSIERPDGWPVTRIFALPFTT